MAAISISVEIIIFGNLGLQLGRSPYMGLSACRDFMRERLDMRCRKMTVISSRADPDKQLKFLHTKLERLTGDASPELMVLLYTRNTSW